MAPPAPDHPDRSDLPPTFVINLESADRRRAMMRQSLDSLEIPFTFHQAVDGRKRPVESFAHYDGPRRRRFFGRDMTPGELGCLESHRQVLQRIRDEALPRALVLEDDVVFRPDFPDVLKALMKTPIPWDMIRFMGSKKIEQKGHRPIAPLFGRYTLARLPSTHGGAHAYLVTREAAIRLLDHSERSWLPIDTLQGRCWETGLESLVVHPNPLVTDESDGSSIGDLRFDKTLTIEGWERRLYPLNRFRFKLCEGLGKRRVYWGTLLRDRRHRRMCESLARPPKEPSEGSAKHAAERPSGHLSE